MSAEALANNMGEAARKGGRSGGGGGGVTRWGREGGTFIERSVRSSNSDRDVGPLLRRAIWIRPRVSSPSAHFIFFSAHIS